MNLYIKCLLATILLAVLTAGGFWIHHTVSQSVDDTPINCPLNVYSLEQHKAMHKAMIK